MRDRVTEGRGDPRGAARPALRPGHQPAHGARRVAPPAGRVRHPVRVLAEEWSEVRNATCPRAGPRIVDGRPGCAEGAEIVLVLGGDGTLLRAAELARPAGRRCSGSTSAGSGSWPRPSRRRSTTPWTPSSSGRYGVEERMTIDAVARRQRRRGRPDLGAQRGHRREGHAASACSRWCWRSTGARCPRSAATACCARRRPGRPPTRSPPAARWCGRRSRRCCWCRATPTRCSPGRW